MRMHYIQHVPFENPAYILEWADKHGVWAGRSLLYRNDPLPSPDDFDLLIIMGGSMNIYEERRYPWLKPEKECIRQLIEAGKGVLGICLGAQLVGDALGGSVSRGEHKEIGWFEVSMTGNHGRSSGIFGSFPETFTAFHWHGDVIQLPEGVTRIARSAACPVQAFEYNGRIAGLQFHLESTEESIEKLIQNCSAELVQGRYNQQAKEIREGYGNLPAMHGLMDEILNNLCAALQP